MTKLFLNNFYHIIPTYKIPQSHSLEWIQKAHQISANDEFTSEWIEKAVRRFSCKPDQIEFRHSFIDDFNNFNWNDKNIYALNENPAGSTISKRMLAFDQYSEMCFDMLFKNSLNEVARNLLHVTCTGYVAPSAAQKYIQKTDTHQKTLVTHLYHMGCYASIPALRVASGLISNKNEKNNDRIDIVHTEICSIHLNPTLHHPEQLVAQSLFSDGAIRYSLDSNANGNSFEIIALDEWIIPNSLDEMSWNLTEYGMRMTLSRFVPQKITKSLKEFVNSIRSRANLNSNNPIYAIHPGGPRILSEIKNLLQLSDSQIEFSNTILKYRGNMSSATLPHIWELILNDRRVEQGQEIISLAFGPGLTLCGAIFKKC